MPETITRPRAASISADRLGEAPSERAPRARPSAAASIADHPPAGGDQPRRVGRCGRPAHQLCAKMSTSPQPARSSRARCGRKSKQACASSRAPLARQPLVERRAQPVQVEHVRGGIVELRRAQRVRAPVARLLLLGDVDLEQLAHAGPSARGGRCRSGPAARRSWCSRPARVSTPKRLSSTAMSNRPKWKSLSAAGIGEQRREVRRLRRPGRDLHQVRVAVAARELHQAEPVARRAAAPWSRCRSPPPARGRARPAGRPDGGSSPWAFPFPHR